ALVRPVKAGGRRPATGGRRAPSDDLPPVKSQRFDLRKRGDSIRRSTQNGTRAIAAKTFTQTPRAYAGETVDAPVARHRVFQPRCLDGGDSGVPWYAR